MHGLTLIAGASYGFTVHRIGVSAEVEGQLLRFFLYEFDPVSFCILQQSDGVTVLRCCDCLRHRSEFLCAYCRDCICIVQNPVGSVALRFLRNALGQILVRYFRCECSCSDCYFSGSCFDTDRIDACRSADRSATPGNGQVSGLVDVNSRFVFRLAVNHATLHRHVYGRTLICRNLHTAVRCFRSRDFTILQTVCIVSAPVLMINKQRIHVGIAASAQCTPVEFCVSVNHDAAVKDAVVELILLSAGINILRRAVCSRAYFRRVFFVDKVYFVECEGLSGRRRIVRADACKGESGRRTPRLIRPGIALRRTCQCNRMTVSVDGYTVHVRRETNLVSLRGCMCRLIQRGVRQKFDGYRFS